MRVNEIVSRCRADQLIIIRLSDKSFIGIVHDIVSLTEYRLYRIGDMVVTNISSDNSILWIKAVKV
jgi:hypothetical protein